MIDEHGSVCAEQYISYRQVVPHEDYGPRQALTNERLRRKREKALPLEQTDDNHSDSHFYFYTEMLKARNCLRQQELQKGQRRLQKAKKARVQGYQKQARTQAIEARCRTRAQAWILRQAEKAREVANRASRVAAHGGSRTASTSSKKCLKMVRDIASRLLLQQYQRRQLVRKLRIIKRLQVLQ
jgi:hypothetical protein